AWRSAPAKNTATSRLVSDEPRPDSEKSRRTPFVMKESTVAAISSTPDVLRTFHTRLLYWKRPTFEAETLCCENMYMARLRVPSEKPIEKPKPVVLDGSFAVLWRPPNIITALGVRPPRSVVVTSRVPSASSGLNVVM